MKRISCSTLGNNGRLGNQMFQFAICRKLAQINNAQLEVPADWIGRKLWHVPEPPLTLPQLPKCESDKFDFNATDYDFFGFGQFQRAVAILSRAELKQWFTFKTEFVNRFSKKRSYYAAAHLRRGDYITASQWAYCLIPENSYVKAFHKFKVPHSDVIWVREDRPEVDPEMEAKGLGFLPDFFTLINADIIFRANSTFSWWAAVLGNPRKIYSPLVGSKIGIQHVEFIEGNWPLMAHPSRTGGVLTDLRLPE